MAQRFLSVLTISATKSNSPMNRAFIRLMSSSSKSNVGFIGLGCMGSHMANNLLKKGHNLNVYDVSKTAYALVKGSNVTVCNSVQDVAAKSDFVVTMLPNNDIVYDTYDEITKGKVNSRTIFIDSSTIDPGVAKKVQKLVKSCGATFVDAPVSGGVIGAENATLTFMVGGTKEEYEAVKQVLECMGKQITHCGDYGMGQAAKICNNMLLGISMIGVCETMNLAIRLGLDPKTFSSIINSSTGRCWSSEIYNPVPGICVNAPANKDYNGGFSTELITKDLGLASNVAITSNTPIPLGAAAHQIYRTLQTKGLGKKDFSIAYKFFTNESSQ